MKNLLYALVVFAFCLTSKASTAETEPLRNDLGNYTRKITTRNPKAQRYFNQGLAFIAWIQSRLRDSFFPGSG